MSIKTYKKENDLCLLRYDEKYYYLGCIDLPQSDWTIEQYNIWQHRTTVNLIPLNSNYIPQQLSHYGLVIQESLHGCQDYYATKYNTDHVNFNKNGNFKDLLSELIILDKPKYIQTFTHWVESFYKPQE